MELLNKDALRKLRLEAELTQENIADVLKKQQSSYSRLENGQTKLRMEHIPSIAKALKKSPDEVIKALNNCSVYNSVNTIKDHAQNIVNMNDVEVLKLLLIEKDKRIELLEKMLKDVSS